jgi:hypothetical protein
MRAHRGGLGTLADMLGIGRTSSRAQHVLLEAERLKLSLREDITERKSLATDGRR